MRLMTRFTFAGELAVRHAATLPEQPTHALAGGKEAARARSVALIALFTASCAPAPPPPAPAGTPGSPPPVLSASSAPDEPAEPPVTVPYRAAVVTRASDLAPAWRDGVVQGKAELWPSGEQANVLFEVQGRAGAPLFLLAGKPNMAVSEAGKVFLGGEPAMLYDLAGGPAQPLGTWNDAEFYDRGKRLYVWSDSREGVLDVATGKPITEQPLDTGGTSTIAYLEGDPPRVIRQGEGLLRVSDLPGLRPLVDNDALYSCVAPNAEAVLSFTSETLPGSRLPGAVVYQRLSPPGKPVKNARYLETLPSACTFDRKGDRVAWSVGGIEMIDPRAPRIKTLFGAGAPMHPRYAIDGLAFTEDGRHVCAEQSGTISAYATDGSGPLPDTALQAVYCFLESPARIVRVPGTKGYEKWPSVSGLYFHRFTQSLSPDRATAAVVQIERLPPGKVDDGGVERKLGLILSDVASSTVLHRIEIGKGTGPDLALFDVTFTRDGETVCVRGGPISVAYDVSTGAPVPMPELPPPGETGEHGRRSGALEIFTDRVEEIATGQAVRMGRASLDDLDAAGSKLVFSMGGARAEVDIAPGRSLDPDSRAPGAERPALHDRLIYLPGAAGSAPRTLALPAPLSGYSWRSVRKITGDRLLLVGWSVAALLDLSGALLATIVPTSPDGAVAFYPSGRYERIGRVEPADGLFCRDGMRTLPLSACARALEVTGRLAKLF